MVSLENEQILKPKKAKKRASAAIEDVVENQAPKKKKKKKNKENKGNEAVSVAEDVKTTEETKDEDSEDGLEENLPFRKNFYTMHEITTGMSKEEVKAYRDEHNIVLYGKGRKKFKPILTFPELGFSKSIMKICSKFERPTPIQVVIY